MIEDKKLGLKIAKDPEEAMMDQTMEKITADNRQMRFSIELNEVILKYLEAKCQKKNK